MKFDRFAISLLLLRADAPPFSEEEEARLQEWKAPVPPIVTLAERERFELSMGQ